MLTRVVDLVTRLLVLFCVAYCLLVCLLYVICLRCNCWFVFHGCCLVS